MSLFKDDNTSTSTPPETYPIDLFHNTYTPSSVPPEILAMFVKDNMLHVDVLEAGPMVGTNLDQETAEDNGLVKNHWVWRVRFVRPDGMIGQIVFGFSSMESQSIASNAAQYVGSSHVGSGSDGVCSRSGSDDLPGRGGSEGARYSDVESLEEPPILDTGSIEAGVANLSVAGGVAKVKASDDNSKPFAPSIRSSTGSRLYQPTEGAPVPGCLEIKVRLRTQPSWRTYLTRSFNLKPNTTFRELLSAMTSRHMEPFKFRKIGTAYLGCRDGISQAAAAWKAAGILLDFKCVAVDPETPGEHLYDLLCWRFTRPTVSTNLSDNEGEVQEVVRGEGRSVSWIDRAVWPADYVYVEHEKLLYNQHT